MWMLTQRTRQLLKLQYNDREAKQQVYALAKPFQSVLSKKRIEKMHVDKSGVHCFLICSDSVFYANFNANSLQQILVEEPNSNPKPALHFTCLDIKFIVEEDDTSFELVAGTTMGEIYYG